MCLKCQVAGLMIQVDGNPAARDFVWFSFSSIFPQKKAGVTFIIAGENS